MNHGWILMLLACMPAAAISSPPEAPASDHNREALPPKTKHYMTQECVENRKFQECLGVSVSECQAIIIESLKACRDPSTGAITVCLDKNIRQRTNLSRSEFDVCENHFEPSGNLDLTELRGESTPRPENFVTLPVYPNRIDFRHVSDLHDIKLNGKSLGDRAVNVLSIVSQDPISKVVSFYKERLQGFNTIGDPTKDYTFIKGEIPDLQDPNAWKKRLLSEHVHIRKKKGRATIIDIGYYPRSD